MSFYFVDDYYRDEESWVKRLRLREYYVYIMASYRGTIYTGVTNDLNRRVFEHRQKVVDGFTSKYNVSKLVFYEDTDDVTVAISREKQIKGWRRSKKVALIESINPYWIDLAEDWYKKTPTSPDPSSRTGGTQGDKEICTPG